MNQLKQLNLITRYKTMNTQAPVQGLHQGFGQAQTEDSAPQAKTFSTKFRFRRIKESALDAIVPTVDIDETTLRNHFAQEVETNANGEQVPTGHLRRKEETHNLELPEWYESVLSLLPTIEANHLATVIQRHIEDFVKSEYVDNYMPIGLHSWSDIATKAATSGRKGSFTIDEEVYADAIKSIVEYVVNATGAPTLQTHLTKALEGKFSRAAIQRNLGVVKEDTILKLKNHLNGWAEFIGKESAELAEDYVEVYSYLQGRLDNLLGASQIDIANML